MGIGCRRPDRASAVAETGAQPHSDCVFVRGRSLDGPARRRRGQTADHGAGGGDRCRVFAGWIDACLHRRVRRQRGCLRHACDGRRAAAADLSSGAGRSRGLDAGRQARSFRLGARDSQRWCQAIHLARGRRRAARRIAAADCARGIVFRRRLAPGLRAAVSMAGSVEALSRRADEEDLDRQPGGFEHRQDSAGQFQRLQPHVDRRPHLLPLRPGRAGDAVLLRHQDE